MLVEKWLLVGWLLISIREGDSKTVYGVISSYSAYQERGAYITKFCYHSTLSFVFHIARTHNSYTKHLYNIISLQEAQGKSGTALMILQMVPYTCSLMNNGLQQ